MTREMLVVDISQVLTSAPSDVTCVDHQPSEVSIDDVETNWVSMSPYQGIRILGESGPAYTYDRFSRIYPHWVNSKRRPCNHRTY